MMLCISWWFTKNLVTKKEKNKKTKTKPIVGALDQSLYNYLAILCSSLLFLSTFFGSSASSYHVEFKVYDILASMAKQTIISWRRARVYLC